MMDQGCQILREGRIERCLHGGSSKGTNKCLFGSVGFLGERGGEEKGFLKVGRSTTFAKGRNPAGTKKVGELSGWWFW